MSRIKQIFDSCSNKQFKKYNPENKQDIMIGIDSQGRKCIFVIGSNTSKVGNSSNVIEVYIEKIKEDTRVSFCLKNNDLYDIFVKFCEDIVESAENVERKDIISFVLGRYNSWERLFKRHSNFMPEEKIKGLFGELYFMNKFMIPLYGIEKAIEVWGGPDFAYKDYEVDDTWYEIKALKKNSTTVKISSLQQLESDKEGNLVTIFLDKSNKHVEGAMSLNNIVEVIISNINDNRCLAQFNTKLTDYGYTIDKEYDNYMYEVLGTARYKVTNDFPIIKSSMLPTEVQNCKYELIINSIASYLIGVI